VTHPHQIGPCRRFNLAHNVEGAHDEMLRRLKNGALLPDPWV
jgi:hypothetical protein